MAETRKRKNRRISERGRKAIKWEEARGGVARLDVYDDLGTPAAGWGHNMTEIDINPITGRVYEVGDFVTLEQSEAWFEIDIKNAEAAMAEHVQTPLTQNQYDGLADFVYNLGGKRFAIDKSKKPGIQGPSNVWKAVNEGRLGDVPHLMTTWVKNGQHKRRARSGALFAELGTEVAALRAAPAAEPQESQRVTAVAEQDVALEKVEKIIRTFRTEDTPFTQSYFDKAKMEYIR